VKACVKRDKSDALEAEAICEAVQRPDDTLCACQNGRAAEYSDDPSHSVIARLPTDHGGKRMRAHLAELGLVANPNIANLATLVHQVLSAAGDLPRYARATPEIPIRQIGAFSDEISVLDQQLRAWRIENEAGRGLAAIPSLGIVTATAVAATVTVAAWAHPPRDSR
jgi:transposase